MLDANNTASPCSRNSQRHPPGGDSSAAIHHISGIVVRHMSGMYWTYIHAITALCAYVHSIPFLPLQEPISTEVIMHAYDLRGQLPLPPCARGRPQCDGRPASCASRFSPKGKPMLLAGIPWGPSAGPPSLRCSNFPEDCSGRDKVGFPSGSVTILWGD